MLRAFANVFTFILAFLSGSGYWSPFTKNDEKSFKEMPPIGWPARIALVVLALSCIGVWALMVFTAPKH